MPSTFIDFLLRNLGLEAAGAGLSGVKIRGTLTGAPSFGPAGGASWSLGPLAAANGSLRAGIADAHLLFDADVTVPIRQGEVDFGDTSVEHVGPDSRMGVSPLGVYVDAANGRSFLYQFPSAAAVAGVEYERRDALLGPWVSDRGKLRLQAFVEGLLSGAGGAPGAGITASARQLAERTTLSGELRLGDGRLAGPGVQADAAGSADGHNVVRLQSDAVGRGLTADVATLLLRNASWNAGPMKLQCAEISGALKLRVFVDGAVWRFELGLDDMKFSGLRLSG
jgi:hypothetical protein